MSIAKKGRLVDRNNVFDENIATVSVPNSLVKTDNTGKISESFLNISTTSNPSVLVKTDNNGKIDTNFLRINEIIPPGTVVAYAGTTAPSGWLLCNGAEISRTTFSALFAAIGTAHGSGDGVTTFRIPDYRGMFLRGRDGGVGRDPDRTSRTAMGVGGATGDNVGSVQGHQINSHKHLISTNDSATGLGLGSASFNLPNTGTNNAFASYYRYNQVNAPFNPGDSDSYRAALFGGNETRPINAYVNYIIKT